MEKAPGPSQPKRLTGEGAKRITWDIVLNIATVIVGLCTIFLTGLVIIDRFSPSPASAMLGRQPPEFLDDWETIAAVGHRIGPENAPIRVVVFSDFQCPMCRVFATKTYPEFQTLYPDQSAIIFRHWPLESHRFAYLAAKASECAATQGRFQRFHDLLFSEQEQFGLKTFPEFAEEAGVPDLEAFEACYSGGDPLPTIERDIRDAKRIGGTGTPTVIVNGWLLRGGVGVSLLDSIARGLSGSG